MRRWSTPAHFRKLVEDNPYWVRDELEPTGEIMYISTFCDLGFSPIAYLSDLVYFFGRNNTGQSASLFRCKNLHTLRGTFFGSVCASKSHIREIDPEKFQVCRTDNTKFAAVLEECPYLTVATGQYPGRISFMGSGIKKTRRLKVNMTPDDGITINLANCPLESCEENLLNDPKVIITPELRKKLMLNVEARKGLRKAIGEPFQL